MPDRLLVIDDDAKLCSLLKEYLESYGFTVATWPEGRGVLGAIADSAPDLIVLDIMLPGKSGLEVLRDIRGKSNLPVIMLTAKGEDADRIVGLELGADDYLAKPFNTRELLARIKVVLRRVGGNGEPPNGHEGKDIIEVGDLRLDRSRRSICSEENEIDLSATEYKIMETLMRRPDAVFTRDQLLSAARGREAEPFERSIDVHISNLRNKLKKPSSGKERIKTVWGTGYMFVSKP